MFKLAANEKKKKYIGKYYERENMCLRKIP